MANDKGSEIDWSATIHWLITAGLMWKVFGWQYGAVMIAPIAVAVVLYAILAFLLRKGA